MGGVDDHARESPSLYSPPELLDFRCSAVQPISMRYLKPFPSGFLNHLVRDVTPDSPGHHARSRIEGVPPLEVHAIPGDEHSFTLRYGEWSRTVQRDQRGWRLVGCTDPGAENIFRDKMTTIKYTHAPWGF